MYASNFQLTHREREVLCLVASGQTDRKIAESLIISPRTVNRHMSNILVKLDVSSRAAAAAHAVRRGLI
jgi:DNA-binding CsgD family transcriptional regulator